MRKMFEYQAEEQLNFWISYFKKESESEKR